MASQGKHDLMLCYRCSSAVCHLHRTFVGEPKFTNEGAVRGGAIAACSDWSSCQDRCRQNANWLGPSTTIKEGGRTAGFVGKHEARSEGYRAYGGRNRTGRKWT